MKKNIGVDWVPETWTNCSGEDPPRRQWTIGPLKEIGNFDKDEKMNSIDTTMYNTFESIQPYLFGTIFITVFIGVNTNQLA